MKRIAFLICIFVTLMSLSLPIFAGCIPDSFMSGNQKALFIGVLSEITDTEYKIVPKTILMGEVDTESVIIPKFKSYATIDEPPQKDDCVVIRLLTESTIDESWVFKVTSTDYKTLKLVTQSLYGMNKQYEEYINQGEYQKAQERLDAEKAKLKAKPAVAAPKIEHSDEPFKTKSVSTFIMSPSLKILIFSGVLIVGYWVFRTRRKQV